MPATIRSRDEQASPQRAVAAVPTRDLGFDHASSGDDGPGHIERLLWDLTHEYDGRYDLSVPQRSVAEGERMSESAGSVFCSHCGQAVDWLETTRVSKILDVSARSVVRLIAEGRLPGAVKYKPPGREPAFWKIPVSTVINFMRARGDIA